MNEITAVNTMLMAIGAQPVSALGAGDSHSARAQETLARTRKSILKAGYHFNKYKVDLPTDTSGKVPLARNHLWRVFPDSNLSFRRHTDNALYVWNIEKNDWYDAVVKDFKYVLDVPDYLDIPEHFMEWIAWQASVEFYNQIISDAREVPAWIIIKFTRAKADALNSLPPTNINQATGYATRKNTVTGSDAIVNVDGESIRV